MDQYPGRLANSLPGIEVAGGTPDDLTAFIRLKLKSGHRSSGAQMLLFEERRAAYLHDLTSAEKGEEHFMWLKNRSLLAAVAIIALAATAPSHVGPAFAADGAVKIGLIIPMTGGQASTGKQLDNAVKLYIQQHGDTVAGKKIEVILKDDGANPENTKRLAQELIVNDKVEIIAGFGITPTALAAAPLATQAKIPEIVMLAGTSIITERSPYIVRTSFTLAQSSTIIGDWAAKNGIKKVATLTSDYAPGNDALNFFKEHFTAGGGEIVEEVKVPLANPDFAPFLQRMRDSKPDAMFVFVPGGQGGNFMKQFSERGLDKSGIKVIGPGDVMDDDLLNAMGDAALGTVTAHMYSAAHPSQVNKDFVAAYKKAFSSRPGFVAVGGYDGIHLIYEALKKTGGKADGDSLVAAMKGMAWESPRGPISIDPETRDIVQNIYIRKVEKVDGELYNVEFQTFEKVKDPGKTRK
jgi:branched-chain amino acid transport system substrate-binding protein